MTNRDLAEKIYEDLNKRGADLGNASIGIIRKTLDDNGVKNYSIPDVSVSLFNEALRVLRDLAEHQNGAPLIRHEKEYNETMHEVWDFLEANET